MQQIRTVTLLRPRVALLCAAALAGVYLCASGLLRLDEVFVRPPSSPPQTAPSESSSASSGHSEPQYDRLVIVLIDALRADMVLGSDAMYGRDNARAGEHTSDLSAYMPFTRSLVDSGQALGYVAHASVPTGTNVSQLYSYSLP